VTDADGADWPPDRTEAKTPLALFGAQLDVTDRTARPRDPGVVEVHEADEWAAVYLEGKLVHQGERYLANEWVREHFGVVTVQDDAFMCGSDRREDVAQTLDEVAEYAAERATRAERAADLERRASEMFDEARRLRQQR
jgi:hypothetical protein